MRGEADARDKAENGKKADLFMAPERRKMKMCFCPSVLRHSLLKVGCCCYGLWYFASPFLLRNFSKEFKKA